MKLTDSKDIIRHELEQNSEFIRVKNTSEGHAWGIVEADGVPFLIFRDVTPPNEVYLSQLALSVYMSRINEIGHFATILKELLNE